jgi:hypothetical protein
MVSAGGVADSNAVLRADDGAAAPGPSIPTPVLFCIPILLAALVYFPITGNYFFADDFLHLYRVRNEGILPYLLIPRGGHLLVTSNAVFYVMDLFFGSHPEPYYWLALLTHLVNVGLLFAVIRLFTQSPYVACFGAALWGIAPLNEAAIGWYSVFGQVLVATVMLIMLYQLGRVAAGYPMPRRAPLIWCGLLLAACTSFGVGIGLTLAFPVAAFLLLPPSPTRTRIVIILAILAIVVPALYFALTRITTIVYNPRTAPIFFEPNPITNLLMLTSLLDYGVASVVVSQVVPQLDYPTLLAHAITALFVIGLIATLLTAPPAVRRQILFCIVLCVGCYGMIVIGRAAFFAAAGRSQAFIRPGRYHYAPPIPAAIALCVMLAYLGTRIRLRPMAKNALLGAWIVIALAAHYAFARPIDHHAAARRETNAVLEAVSHAIDAGTTQGVYIPNRPFQSLGPIFVTRQDIFPGWAGVFVIFYPENQVDGKPVYFVTPDPKVISAAQEGRRTNGLIIQPPG